MCCGKEQTIAIVRTVPNRKFVYMVGDVQRLSYLAEHTDPLTYPLVHVAGTLGWSTNLEYCADHLPSGAKQLRITLAEFYAHRLMMRAPPSSTSVQLPHGGGRLFQQYIVDAYAKLESTRLDWVMKNQDKLPKTVFFIVFFLCSYCFSLFFLCA